METNTLPPRPKKMSFDDASKIINPDAKVLSDAGRAIALSLRSRVERARRDDNQGHIEQRKDLSVIEDLIDKLSDDDERDEIKKQFEALKEALDDNSSYLRKYFSDVKMALVDKKPNTEALLLNITSGLKDSFVGELNPMFRGIFTTTSDFFKGRMERRERVEQEIRNIDTTKDESRSSEDVSTSSSSNDRRTSESFTRVNREENNSSSETFTRMDEEVDAVKHIDETVSRLYDSMAVSQDGRIDIAGLEKMLAQLVDIFPEGNITEDVGVFIKELLVEELSSLSDDKFNRLEGLLDSQKTLDVINDKIMSYESSSYSEEKRMAMTEEIRSLLQQSYEEASKERALRNAERPTASEAPERREHDPIASFSEKEDEETFRRDTVKAQQRTATAVEGIYKLLSGRDFKKSIGGGNADGGGIFDSLLGGLGGFFGGKLLSGLKDRLGKTKIGRKIFGGGVTDALVDKVPSSPKKGGILGGFGERLSKAKDVVSKSRFGKFGALSGLGFGGTALATSSSDSPTNVVADLATDAATDAIFDKGSDSAKTVSTTKPSTAGKSKGVLSKIKSPFGKLGKAVGKMGVKGLLKKVPILGAGFGGLFALQRALSGDMSGAAMELASGVSGSLGPLGTAASVGIDVALAAKDMAAEGKLEEIQTPSFNSDVAINEALTAKEPNAESKSVKRKIPFSFSNENFKKEDGSWMTDNDIWTSYGFKEKTDKAETIEDRIVLSSKFEQAKLWRNQAYRKEKGSNYISPEEIQKLSGVSIIDIRGVGEANDISKNPEALTTKEPNAESKPVKREIPFSFSNENFKKEDGSWMTDRDIWTSYGFKEQINKAETIEDKKVLRSKFRQAKLWRNQAYRKEKGSNYISSEEVQKLSGVGEATTKTERDRILTEFKEERLRKNAEQSTSVRMKSVSFGGVGADDFSFDALTDTKPKKEPSTSIVPFKESILPDVDTITDMDHDYSEEPSFEAEKSSSASEGILPKSDFRREDGRVKSDMELWRDGNYKQRLAEATTKEEKDRILTEFKEERLRKNAEQSTSNGRKGVTFGGVGADDFSFDALTDTKKEGQSPSIIPFKESILPDVDTITDMDHDYSEEPYFEETKPETKEEGIVPKSDFRREDGRVKSDMELWRDGNYKQRLVEATTKTERDRILTEFKEERLRKNAEQSTSVRMKSGSFGGVGADDFSLDALTDTKKEGQSPSIIPFKESILPDVDTITDMDHDYSEEPSFEEIPPSKEESVVTNVLPTKEVVETPKEQTSQRSTNPLSLSSSIMTKRDIYAKHMTKTDDGTVIERSVGDGIDDDLKKHFYSRSSKDMARIRLENEDVARTYNHDLYREIYGDEYSVKTTLYGIYDKNNNMAFTPIVKDERGVITKALKNKSDHIMPGEEGYVSPDTDVMFEENRLFNARKDASNEVLLTRSTEEQKDRRRLNELYEKLEMTFYGGYDLTDSEKKEKLLLEEKVKEYQPLLTQSQERLYNSSSRMSDLIDKRADERRTTTQVSRDKKSIVPDLTSSSKSRKEREAALTHTPTRGTPPPKETTKASDVSQTPTVINNVTNNVTQAPPQQKPQRTPQLLINPVHPNNYQGNGYGGGAR